MAISTYNAKLYYDDSAMTVSGTTVTGGTLIPIKTFPAILGQRSAIETTTLQDDAQTFIQGIRQQEENLDFTCNFDGTMFATLNSLTSAQYLTLIFSDGSYFSWQGFISASNGEGEVDNVIEMTVSVTPTTVPTFTAGS